MAKQIEFGFKALKPISKKEIPSSLRGGVISHMVELRELEAVAKHVKANGASPYEAFDVLDVDKLKKANPEAAKMKTLLSSFLMAGRRILKQYQVEKHLQLQQRENRVFLVSLE